MSTCAQEFTATALSSCSRTSINRASAGTPEDAFRCFMGTGMETPAIGNCILSKDEQDPALAKNYETAFELD